MTVDLARLSPQPKRVGQCASCPYRDTGTPAICYACSIRTIVPLAPDEERCEVCDLPIGTGGSCGNFVCRWSDREFEWNFAIGMRAGVLEQIGNRFKFGGERGWALILGRLLVGFLDEHRQTFEEFDIIISTPGFTGRGAERNWDHALEVVRVAADASLGTWPFETEPPIVRTAALPRFTGKKWKERFAIAGQLRQALSVVRPERIRRKSVLVYDDIFTEGLTLNEVARALRLAGASRICGVTLMRQPYVPKPATAS